MTCEFPGGKPQKRQVNRNPLALHGYISALSTYFKGMCFHLKLIVKVLVRNNGFDDYQKSLKSSIISCINHYTSNITKSLTEINNKTAKQMNSKNKTIEYQ